PRATTPNAEPCARRSSRLRLRIVRDQRAIPLVAARLDEIDADAGAGLLCLHAKTGQRLFEAFGSGRITAREGDDRHAWQGRAAPRGLELAASFDVRSRGELRVVDQRAVGLVTNDLFERLQRPLCGDEREVREPERALGNDAIDELGVRSEGRRQAMPDTCRKRGRLLRNQEILTSTGLGRADFTD